MGVPYILMKAWQLILVAFCSNQLAMAVNVNCIGRFAMVKLCFNYLAVNYSFFKRSSDSWNCD